MPCKSFDADDGVLEEIKEELGKMNQEEVFTVSEVKNHVLSIEIETSLKKVSNRYFLLITRSNFATAVSCP